MIKLAFWNIRGLNDPNKQVAIRNFIYANKVDVLVVLETKVRSDNIGKVRKRICSNGMWEDNNLQDPHGRVWIWWNIQRVKLVVIQSHAQFIHCEILVDDVSFFLFLCLCL